jgi:hypothetical protein
MKTFYQSLLLALGTLALAGTAFAQLPASNDTSTTDSKFNTGMGTGALASNGTGQQNTASGYQALFKNTTGSFNTASGTGALSRNMTGDGNTASGGDALFFNTVGTQNSAFGFDALAANDSGGQNVAVGYQALTNSTVSGNTAVGWQALSSDSTGSSNTAVGSSALAFNQTGTTDVAVGYGALYRNTASSNTAAGWQSLNANTTGAGNTAFGTSALQSNTTGDNNIAEGYQAGFNLTTGSNNIDIGNVGVAGESNVIRIGTKGTHKVTVIAGINSSKVTGSAVYVTTTGRLGVLASSERFKTSIAPIGDSTEKLQQLRPVSFHLKAEPKDEVQYGLIAEEVAKVYPELVIRGEKGRIDGVRYDELAPMLLNEVQQQQTTIAAHAAQLHDVQQQLAEVKDLKRQVAVLSAALQKLQDKHELVAQR